MSVKQLSDGGSAGVCIGQSSTDKVGFFGATPVVRPAATILGALTAATTTAANVAAALVDLRTQLAALGVVTLT